jgi:hypothetical protein
MSHTTALKKAGLPTVETLVRRILRVWANATPADIEAGATWYAEANALAAELADRAGSIEHAAAVISHLSPRSTWARNVAAAIAVVNETALPAGVMSAPLHRALVSLDSATPLDTFGGPKTGRFARNIMGDTEAVTVDVWAARVAGVDENLLGRVGVYDAVEHAFRLAARRVGVTPSTMQATTWIVQRGGRAS